MSSNISIKLNLNKILYISQIDGVYHFFINSENNSYIEGSCSDPDVLIGKILTDRKILDSNFTVDNYPDSYVVFIDLNGKAIDYNVFTLNLRIYFWKDKPEKITNQLPGSSRIIERSNLLLHGPKIIWEYIYLDSNYIIYLSYFSGKTHLYLGITDKVIIHCSTMDGFDNHDKYLELRQKLILGKLYIKSGGKYLLDIRDSSYKRQFEFCIKDSYSDLEGPHEFIIPLNPKSPPQNFEIDDCDIVHRENMYDYYFGTKVIKAEVIKSLNYNCQIPISGRCFDLKLELTIGGLLIISAIDSKNNQIYMLSIKSDLFLVYTNEKYNSYKRGIDHIFDWYLHPYLREIEEDRINFSFDFLPGMYPIPEVIPSFILKLVW